MEQKKSSKQIMSEMTGGQYFRAFNTDSLVEIYSTIDDLEKSELFEDLKVSQTTAWLLLLGASSTFIAHGIEAFEHYGRFVDLLIGSASRVGLRLSQSSAETALTVIGVQDFLLVALLLLRRWRWVAGWMAFWGFATALSRMTTMGSGSWHQTAVRVANGGVPLAIFLAWRPLFRPNS